MTDKDLQSALHENPLPMERSSATGHRTVSLMDLPAPRTRPKLAEDVVELSQFFAEQKGRTPWGDPRMLEAYESYMMPLNVGRLRSVLAEGQRVSFWRGIKNIVDVGAGTGSLARAFFLKLNDYVTLYEPSAEARRFARARHSLHYVERWQDHVKAPSVVSLSYVLNESPELLQSVLHAQPEGVMILEASTHQVWPILHQAREQLREKGYSIWAPCPHQGDCPLAPRPRGDWCFDRIQLDRPDWMLELEQKLPMKNRTVSFAYLLARRTPPAPIQHARLVGDPLREKGKTRQLICQDSQRRFVRWRGKFPEEQELSRGAILPLVEADRLEFDAPQGFGVLTELFESGEKT